MTYLQHVHDIHRAVHVSSIHVYKCVHSVHAWHVSIYLERNAPQVQQQVCVCMYVCMYVCMCVCVCVHIRVCTLRA